MTPTSRGDEGEDGGGSRGVMEVDSEGREDESCRADDSGSGVVGQVASGAKETDEGMTLVDSVMRCRQAQTASP